MDSHEAGNNLACKYFGDGFGSVCAERQVNDTAAESQTLLKGKKFLC